MGDVIKCEQRNTVELSMGKPTNDSKRCAIVFQKAKARVNGILPIRSMRDMMTFKYPGFAELPKNQVEST